MTYKEKKQKKPNWSLEARADTFSRLKKLHNSFWSKIGNFDHNVSRRDWQHSLSDQLCYHNKTNCLGLRPDKYTYYTGWFHWYFLQCNNLTLVTLNLWTNLKKTNRFNDVMRFIESFLGAISVTKLRLHCMYL